jgi:CubicO group peptidase (beta-lactamase class C family)
MGKVTASVAGALWIFTTLTATALFSAAPMPGQETVGARQMFDGAMRPDEAVRTLANSDKLFPTREIKHGLTVRALPASKKPLRNVRFEAHGKRYDLYDYLALNRIAGLLVLKNGEIALEDYELGAGLQTHWASFSMGKSVSSTLVGAALADGSIKSLDDPVTRYVPALKNGAYERVTVRNVIQMASGVKWDETYTDPKSDRRKLLDVQLQFKPGAILSFMSALSRAGVPGTIWNYNTGETFVVGAVVEGATHQPLATYLTDKIWSRWAMENDARWWLESPNGIGWGGGGISATLRDFGRFALFVLADGVINGQRTVPVGWFDEAGSPKQIGGEMVDYGYLWWPLPKGDPVLQGSFEAIGIFGQHMYINRRAKLAIVVLSARPKPTGSDVVEDSAFFAAVTKALE